MITKETNLVIATAVFLAITIIDFYFKSTMMDWSVIAIKYIQSWPRILYYWYWIFAGPVYYLIPVIGHLCFFMLGEKNHALMIFMMIGFENTVTNLLKLIYNDLRPCFLDQEIADFACTCSFGKPSGHSSSSVTLYVGLYYILIHSNARISRNVKRAIIVATAIMLLNVGASRLYFGAHFINQVLLGWALAYLILSIFYILHRNGVFETIVYPYGTEKHRRKTIMNIIIGVFLIIHVLILISWYFVRYYLENKTPHPFNETDCADKCVQSQGFLSDVCITASSFYTSIVYISIGFRLREGELAVYNSRYYSVFFSNIKIISIRLLVWILVMSPLALGLALSKQKGLMMWISNNGFCLIFALLFFFAMRPLMRLLNVSVKGDYFEVDAGEILEEKTNQEPDAVQID